MKQITYDPVWKMTTEVSKQLKEALENHYIGQTLVKDSLTQTLLDASRDYYLFGDIHWINMNISLGDGSGESVWRKQS